MKFFDFGASHDTLSIHGNIIISGHILQQKFIQRTDAKLGTKCSSSTSISITLLSGESHELHTKNDVQEMYRGRPRNYEQQFLSISKSER